MAKLYFRYGAMGSSKTANAVMVQYNYRERGCNVLMLKPQLENRDGATIVRSRCGLQAECRFVEDLDSMDLTDVDWDQWSVVAVVSDPLPYAADFSSLSINCPTVNIQREISGEVTPAVGPNLLLLFPMRDGGRQIRYLIFPGGQMAASTQGTYNDITGLTLSSNAANGLRKGSSITVYGIR